MKKLLAKLKKLNLPSRQYAIYGSGPLGIRGIKKVKDLDIVVKDDLYKKILKKYQEIRSGCIKIGNIEIFPTWNAIISEPDKVINRAEEIDGFKFIRLSDLIIWKKKMGRKKDFQDIKLIEEYLKKKTSKF